MLNKIFTNMFTIILLLFLVFVLVNNWGCAVNPQYLENDEFAKVIVTGQGNSEGAALDNAFSEAIRKAFGARVDSEQVVSNQVLVKNEIIVTNAERDSRIKTYKILEQSQKGDVYFTKIEALVSTTHLTKVSFERKIIREEWNQFVSGPNPVVGVAQVGMKIGEGFKQQYLMWFGKAKE
jgi:hypothetical protein